MSPAAVLLLALLLQVEPSPHLGLLEVRSLPGAEVVWEGVPLGRTDGDGLLEIAGIPPGTYAVELRKDGHVPAEAEVEISAAGRAFLRLPLAEDAVPAAPPTGDATPQTPRQPSAAADGDRLDPAAVVVAALAAVLLLASWRLARRRPRLATPSSSAFPPNGLAPDGHMSDEDMLDDDIPDDEPATLGDANGEPLPAGRADFLTELRRRERILDPAQDDDILDADVIAEELS